MAHMIPDAVREGTVSRAERRLFNRFRSELAVDMLSPDHEIASRLHYCGLSRARTMLVVMEKR